MKKYKAAIFDLGGVLFSTDWALMNKTLEDMVGVPIFPKKGGIYSFYVNLQTGAITPDKYFDLLTGEVNKKVSFETMRDAYQHAYSSSTKINEDIISLVKALKKNLALICSSTTNVLHYEVNLKRGLFDNFDQVYLSHVLGFVGAPFVKNVLDSSGFEPSAILYVDDNGELCEYVRKLNATSIKFEDTAQLRSALKNLRVIDNEK